MRVRVGRLRRARGARRGEVRRGAAWHTAHARRGGQAWRAPGGGAGASGRTTAMAVAAEDAVKAGAAAAEEAEAEGTAAAAAARAPVGGAAELGLAPDGDEEAAAEDAAVDVVVEEAEGAADAAAQAAAEAAAEAAAAAAAYDDDGVDAFRGRLEGALRPGGWRATAREALERAFETYMYVISHAEAVGETAADRLEIDGERRELAVRLARLLPLFIITQTLVVFSIVYALRGSLKHTSAAKARQETDAQQGKEEENKERIVASPRPSSAKKSTPKAKSSSAKKAAKRPVPDLPGSLHDVPGCGEKTAERITNGCGWETPADMVAFFQENGEDEFKAALKAAGVRMQSSIVRWCKEM